MKHWYEFEEQDITNILSGLSHTVNKLKSILDNKDYEAFFCLFTIMHQLFNCSC